MIACSGPQDCAEIEQAHATGIGLLVNGGSSRGEPALRRGRRGDPDRQPDRARRTAPTRATARSSQTGFNVTPDARPLLLGGRARVDGGAAGRPPRRAPAGASRRRLSVHAGGDVRDRPRPDRLRRPHGHDARPARGLRDVLELRRGRAPLRPRAGRHARGAAQARPAVRPDRPRAPLRAAPLPDRRPLRPRPDPGRDVQAAQRLRARRARRALARATAGSTGDRRRRRAAARWPGWRSARRPAPRPRREAGEERRLGERARGRARLGQPRARLPDGGAAAADAGGDRRAPPAAAPGAARASARRLAARPLRASTGRSCSARAGARYLADGPRRGRGPARRASRRRAAAHLLRTDGFAARRRHHGRQLLRPASSTRAARSRS